MIVMQDVVTLAEVQSGGYGKRGLEILGEVDALFLQSSSRSHSMNVDIREADAHVYLDIENPIVKDRSYRLEGLYLLAEPFGGSEDYNWYMITRVVVGQRKLLDNDVDNVHAYLKRTAKLEVL